jgi:hypothetical protein
MQFSIWFMANGHCAEFSLMLMPQCKLPTTHIAVRKMWCLDETCTNTQPTLRSTHTVRPSDILSHATIYYCYTSSPIRYVQELTFTRAKSGHSVACVRMSTGNQQHIHLTECPPYGRSTFVRRKIWSVTPNRGYRPMD